MAWRDHFFYRKESLRTTWKFRILVVLLPLVLVTATRGFWTVKVGESLVCTQSVAPSDALLLENFDPDYLVFESARNLRKIGVASRILVPVRTGTDSTAPDYISKRLAEVMAEVARIEFEVIPIQEIEPISLNAANQIREFLQAERIKSVVVVAPDFRSRRSFLIYNRVFSPAGISTGCFPVFGRRTTSNWADSWHGLQEVGLQFLKLQFYRFYVFR